MLAMGMGKTRNKLLAEHYLKVAGIAAVHVDIDGAIGTQQLIPG
jgi:hypothetical protein